MTQQAASLQRKDGSNGDGDEDEVSVFCSFLQMCTDQPHDLIRDPQRQNPLKLSSQNDEILVIGLSEYQIHNVSECFSVLEKGDQHRASRTTRMNDVSSRSFKRARRESKTGFSNVEKSTNSSFVRLRVNKFTFENKIKTRFKRKESFDCN